MIRYFAGSSGSGKTYAIYEELKALKGSKEASKCYLIVPEQFTLKAEMAIAEAEGFGGIQITSFRRLIQRVLEETGLPQGDYIDDVGKAVAVRQAFLKVGSSLQVFSKVQERSGFIKLFGTWLSELRQSGLSPQALLIDHEALSGTTKAKLGDTALVYQAYMEKMQEGYYDEESLYARMAEAVMHSEQLRDAQIWVDGFYFFNGLEHKILQAMGKVAKQLTIALTFDPENLQREPFDAPVDAFTQLHRGFSEAGLEIKKRQFKPLDKLQPQDIGHLCENLFHYPGAVRLEAPERVKLWQLEQPLYEVLWVASHIRKCHLEDGISYGEMAVLHQQAEVYEPLIRRYFELLDLNFYMDQTRQLTHSPLVTYIRSVLEALSGNFKTEALLRALKTGLMPFEKEEVDRLESYVIERGIERHKWLKTFKDESVEVLRLRLIEPLVTFKKELETEKSSRALALLLWQHIESDGLKLRERFEALMKALIAQGDSALASELSQGWQGVLEVLEQMVLVAKDEPVTLKTFNELLATGFSLKEMRGLPPARDSLVVSHVTHFRSEQKSHIFILGMNDGVIPSLKDGSSILSDDEKLQLQALNFPIKSDSFWLSKNEMFLLYQAMSRAGAELHLSYSLASSEGKPLRPSMYIDRCQTIMPQLKPMHLSQEAFYKAYSDYHPRLLMLGTSDGIRRMAAGYPVDDYWLKRLEWLASQRDYKDKARGILTSVFYENQPRPLSRQSVQKLYGKDIRASITRLEAFNACPFSHFVRFGLRPKKEKRFEVGLPDMGNLFHTAVERFALESLLNKPGAPSEMSPQAIDSLMDRIVEETVARPEYEVFHEDARNAYMIHKLKRTGKRAARLMMSHLQKGKFEPQAFEVAFGLGTEGIPPIVIELPSGETIYLEGRIDRVDFFDSGQRRYVKVIDYKSGFKKYHLGDVYNGLQIQLAVYMDAVLSHYEAFKTGHPLSPAGMFYFKIDDPMIEAEDLSQEDIQRAIEKQLRMDGLVIGDRYVAAFMDENLSEEGAKSDVIPYELKKEGEPGRYASYLSEAHFEALLNHVRQGIYEVCQAMTAGNVSISPYRCGNEIACDRCDYKGICQFDLSFKDNRYRPVHRLDRDDLIEKLEEVSQHDKVD